MDDLCQLCREINLYTLGAYYGSPERSGGAAAITRSRDQLRDDCPLCQFFLNIETGEEPPLEVEKITIRAKTGILAEPTHIFGALRSLLGQGLKALASRLGKLQYYPLSVIFLEIQRQGVKFPIPIYLNVVLDDDSPQEAAKYICGRTVKSANSDANLETVSGWLKECLSGHSDCRIGLSNRKFDDKAETTPLPDRVIEVRTAAEGPRLLETEGRRGLYVALSYCWEPYPAEHPPFRLLKENKADLERGIQASELPLTIQDAIDFTRRLGLSYIWIDRLCIIQEDDEDCRTQIAQMCDIYERASLTIAAIAAAGREEGLYLPREPQTGVRLKCATKDKDLGHMRIAMRHRMSAATGDNEAPFEMTSFGREMTSSRWNTRGWVMQERLISRRVIYFGRQQLFWECKERTIVEDGVKDGNEVFAQEGKGQSRPKRDLHEGMVLYRRREFLHTWLSWFYKGGRYMPEFWDSIIRDYTSRQLKFGEDKCKAMAGVAEAARQFLRFAPTDYAWGTFLPLADRLLLWHSKGGYLTAPAATRGPSWSWVSYDGRARLLKDEWDSCVGHFSLLANDEARSLGVIIPHQLPDPSVLRISSARLVPMFWWYMLPDRTSSVTSWLEKARNTYDFAGFDGRPAKNKMYLPRLVGEVALKASGINRAKDHMVLGTNATDAICGFLKFDVEDPKPSSNEIHCVIMGEMADAWQSGWAWKRRREADVNKRIYHLLALEPVSSQPDAKMPVFRRVGIAQAVWAREPELGFPIHEMATLKEILVV